MIIIKIKKKKPGPVKRDGTSNHYGYCAASYFIRMRVYRF